MSEADVIGELIGLIDRLENLLDRAALSELEVEAGATAIVLRRPSALGSSETRAEAGSPSTTGAHPTNGLGPTLDASEEAASGLHAVRAPLTGVFYHSPSPGARAYLSVGGAVSSGQVIGLIEAMKLFNEIKSDTTGVVRRFVAEDGALVKARQPLIEVEPA